MRAGRASDSITVVIPCSARALAIMNRFARGVLNEAVAGLIGHDRARSLSSRRDRRGADATLGHPKRLIAGRCALSQDQTKTTTPR